MAASLESSFGEPTEINPGSSGQFDVIADGHLIFSKAATHRFPLDGEVEAIFAALKAGKEPPPPLEAPVPKPGIVGRLVSKLRR